MFVQQTFDQMLFDETLLNLRLIQFAVILSLVFVLEIAAAIAAYSLRSQVIDMLDERLRQAMPYYYQNLEVTDAFDFIQSRVSDT